MNVKDVQEWVDRIRASSGDDESAHGMEDALWLYVLRAIADGADSPRDLARVAASTSEIEFSRWRA